MQLGLTVYVPMVAGQVVQNLFPKQTQKVFMEWKLSKLGQLALLVLVWQTFDRAFETKAFNSVPTDNIIFIIFISIANFLLWLTVSFGTSVFWMDRKDVISVCYCVPGKTLAVGIPLSALLWLGLSLEEEAKLQIPMVLFQAFQVFGSSLLTIPLRKWATAADRKKEDTERAVSQVSDQTHDMNDEASLHQSPTGGVTKDEKKNETNQ